MPSNLSHVACGNLAGLNGFILFIDYAFLTQPHWTLHFEFTRSQNCSNTILLFYQIPADLSTQLTWLCLWLGIHPEKSSHGLTMK